MTAWTMLRCDARLPGSHAPVVCPATFRTTHHDDAAVREAATYGWTETATEHHCPAHRGHVNPDRPTGEVA